MAARQQQSSKAGSLVLASRGNNHCFKSKNHLCLGAGESRIAWELLPRPPDRLVPTVFLWVYFAELGKISRPLGPARPKRRIAGHFFLSSSLRFGRAALRPPSPSSVSSGKGPPSLLGCFPWRELSPRSVKQGPCPPAGSGRASETGRGDRLREPDLRLLLFGSSFSLPHSLHVFPLSYNVFQVSTEHSTGWFTVNRTA